jgi:hypothetical protein
MITASVYKTMLLFEDFGKLSRTALVSLQPFTHFFVLLRYIATFHTNNKNELSHCVMLSFVTAIAIAPTSSFPVSYTPTEATTSATGTTIAPGLYANYRFRFFYVRRVFIDTIQLAFDIPLKALYTQLHVISNAYPTN